MRISGRSVIITVALAVIIGVLISTLRPGAKVSHSVPLAGTSDSLLTPRAAPGNGLSAPESLVLIQGLTSRRLVIWPLDGQSAPVEIDREITSLELRPDPTGRRVLYGTERAVMVLDVAQRRASIAGILPEGAWLTAAQWSPDGSALAYVARQGTHLIAYYSDLRDTEQMLDVHYGLGLDVGWLPDGRPILLTLGLGPVGGFQTQIKLYDPFSRQRIALPPDTPIVQPWSPWRSPDGTQQIYGFSQWEDARYKGECRTGPLVLVGADWLRVAVEGGPNQYAVAFEVKGLFMDWPTWLADGRVIFRGIADPVCTTLASGLYIGRIGEEPRKLVTAEPSYFADESEKQVWSVAYALSPDQTQIAWTDNRVETQRSTIWLVPLDGGTPEPLFQTAALTDPAPFAYRDDELILSFVWLP